MKFNSGVLLFSLNYTLKKIQRLLTKEFVLCSFKFSWF